jgi:hypothetical protein
MGKGRAQGGRSPSAVAASGAWGRGRALGAVLGSGSGGRSGAALGCIPGGCAWKTKQGREKGRWGPARERKGEGKSRGRRRWLGGARGLGCTRLKKVGPLVGLRVRV